MKLRKKEIFHKMQDVIQSIFFQKFKNYKFVHFNKKFKFFEFLIAKQIKINKEVFFRYFLQFLLSFHRMLI